MRDPELLLSLLREMAAQTDGRLKFSMHLGMSDEEQRTWHHLEQLTDSGHCRWDDRKRQFPRITASGYDFIAAVDNNERCMKTFLERFNQGVPYLTAVTAALKLFSAINSGD